MSKFLIILGPTSSGKTSLALNLCKDFKSDIISADSRQIFKYMDIGTGKVPINQNFQKHNQFWEVNNIKIWGYDVSLPTDYFSVVDYYNYVKTLELKKDLNIVVGGTGFYLNALLGNLSVSTITPDWNLRSELSKHSTSDLFMQLSKLNPHKAALIDKNNPARLIRALEIEIKSEGATTDLEQKLSPIIQRDSLIIGLRASNIYLFKRADLWVEFIFESGIESEVKKLIDLNYEHSLPMQGIVYKEVIDYVKGQDSLESVKQKIKYRLHAYIRRQLTYFAKIPNIRWFDVEQKGFDIDIKRLVESKVNE